MAAELTVGLAVAVGSGAVLGLSVATATVGAGSDAGGASVGDSLGATNDGDG